MASKKNKKMQMKDSVDIHEIKNDVVEHDNKENQEIKKVSFKETISNFRFPIYTYLKKLIKNDFKEYKNNPNGESEDSALLKNITNKKRFFIKLSYFICALLISISLIVISVLLLVGTIGSLNFSNGTSTYIPAFLMALGFVIIIFFM